MAEPRALTSIEEVFGLYVAFRPIASQLQTRIRAVQDLLKSDSANGTDSSSEVQSELNEANAVYLGFNVPASCPDQHLDQLCGPVRSIKPALDDLLKHALYREFSRVDRDALNLWAVFTVCEELGKAASYFCKK